MKIKKMILPLLLTVAVLISIFLSMIIWINPSSYQNVNKSSINDSNETYKKTLPSVYSPTQVVKNDYTGAQYILTNQSVNLISEIRTQMLSFSDFKFSKLENVSLNNYKHFMSRKNSLMLNYPDTVTTNILSRVLNNNLKKLPNVDFNRILIPLDDNTSIYLLHDNSKTVYKISLKNDNLNKIKDIISKDVRQIPVNTYFKDNKPMIAFTKSFYMPQYSYLYNTSSQNFFVNRLLPGSNTPPKRHHNTTIYNDQDRRIAFNEKNHEAVYLDSMSSPASSDLSQFLVQSYKNISNLGLGNNLNSIRYFNYNDKNTDITYRNYVEGFPIFDNNSNGAAQMRIIDNVSVRYTFSLDVLQTPVPSGKKDLKMISTKQVVNNLVNLGYDTKKIGTVELGYQSIKVGSSNMLINLKPTWFVQYNGKWINYNKATQNQY
ncbi:two-component system activity regulator YycH [Apilactobacillus sp. TMW 2.2459]|uniref:YycH family regulatory protein n=1 Tax=Apilactobacillus xinyiensis TaxID=2841032 RepID=UPI00200D044C|nr:two-component system activity regulator YycH [Apilactobacillus xinyiensis]MCL0312471.1 two-component system activity regulator YycH [Apilactobacillus xinyiensis]